MKKQVNTSGEGGKLNLFGNNDHFTNKSYGNVHTFYLSGSVGDPSEYIDWFETMRNASETDVINIIINSPGGRLTTALQFLKVMSDTPAHVIVSVDGECMSAATMLFMAADQQEVFEHSMFMFHNYSGGTAGKGAEMYEEINFMKKWSTSFLHKVYKHFMSEEEIDSMLDNKDFWFTAEEVSKRMEYRNEMYDKEEQEAIAAREAESKLKQKTPRKQKTETV